MKEIAISFFTIILMVIILRSDITPWRLISKEELDQVSQQAEAKAKTSTWMWSAESPLQKPATRVGSGHTSTGG
jgi:hypothetical protein